MPSKYNDFRSEITEIVAHLSFVDVRNKMNVLQAKYGDDFIGLLFYYSINNYKNVKAIVHTLNAN